MSKENQSKWTTSLRNSFAPAYRQPYSTTTLSKRDERRFKELIHEKEPNQNLKDAAQKHDKLISYPNKH